MLRFEDVSDASFRPYIELALAVIMQAVEDATLDVPCAPPIAHGMSREGLGDDAMRRWSEHQIARDDARYFLTEENDMLTYWCRVAGLHHRTVLRYAKAASSDWVGLGLRFHLHFQTNVDRWKTRRKVVVWPLVVNQ